MLNKREVLLMIRRLALYALTAVRKWAY